MDKIAQFAKSYVSPGTAYVLALLNDPPSSPGCSLKHATNEAASMGWVEGLASLFMRITDETKFERERRLEAAIETTAQHGHTQATKILYQAGGGLNRAMFRSTEAGHLDTTIKINSWRQDNWRIRISMISAADGGDIATLKLLHNWIPEILSEDDKSVYCMPLNHAAQHGHIRQIKLMRKWGATMPLNASSVLTGATLSGRLSLMKQAKKWGATNLDANLCTAAEFGQLAAMKLVYSWGATKFLDESLLDAAEKGQIEAMEQLHKWGARGYEKIVTHYTEEFPEVLKMVKKWIDEEGY